MWYGRRLLRGYEWVNDTLRTNVCWGRKISWGVIESLANFNGLCAGYISASVALFRHRIALVVSQLRIRWRRTQRAKLALNGGGAASSLRKYDFAFSLHRLELKWQRWWRDSCCSPTPFVIVYLWNGWSDVIIPAPGPPQHHHDHHHILSQVPLLISEWMQIQSTSRRVVLLSIPLSQCKWACT